MTDVLRTRHDGMAQAQAIAPTSKQRVYGEIWSAVHEGLESDLADLVAVRMVRPHRAPYQVPVIGGTVLFPWHYARDATKGIDTAPLTRPVSSTRRMVLNGELRPQPTLFDDDSPSIAEDDPGIAALREEFRTLQNEYPVVVLGYASSMAGLYNAYWGDCEHLTADGLISWGYRERIDLNGGGGTGFRLTAVPDPDNFDGPPLVRPAIRRRPRRHQTSEGESGTDGGR